MFVLNVELICSNLFKMKLVKFPLKITGLGIGLGMAGEILDSQPLKDGGSAATKFISPVINITMGGYVIKQLKKIKLKEDKK